MFIQGNSSTEEPTPSEMRPVDGESARIAYEAFAPAYDDFTHAYMNGRWTARLLARAEKWGASGNQLLDVACGTGKSFIPMLDRGWEATACDISAAMVEVARDKAGNRAAISVADMRELPTFGAFDLVWALDDAINYLGDAEELRSTLTGMGRNLAPSGVLLFDVNTLLVFRTFFCSETVVDQNDRRLIWRGQGNPDEVEPSSVGSATLEADDGSIEAHVHHQRHFTEAEILAAIAQAELRCREIVGERDGDLFDGADEDLHTKAVYVCTRH